MKTLDNLVSPREFAELVRKHNKKSKCRDVTVYAWMAPQRIEPTVIGGKRFVDTKKYNPKKFK